MKKIHLGAKKNNLMYLLSGDADRHGWCCPRNSVCEKGGEWEEEEKREAEEQRKRDKKGGTV